MQSVGRGEEGSSLQLHVLPSHEDSVIEAALSSESIACSLEEEMGPGSVFETVHSVTAQEPPITPPPVQPLPPLQSESSPGPGGSMRLMEDMVRAIRRQTRAIMRQTWAIILSAEKNRVVSRVSKEQRQAMEHMRVSIIDEIVRHVSPSSGSSESEPISSTPPGPSLMSRPGTREGSHRRRRGPRDRRSQ
ncbi:Hypothetical predicted protein [Pelobates cultripes]|uniref:Uncharacterized protein n=1 Tax=Pelobates cultripes TaxID=61616 RepID=A0AAD1WAY2_PELCU|nr:Hypothetical predicted protein [Pelobates cultripes]